MSTSSWCPQLHSILKSGNRWQSRDHHLWRRSRVTTWWSECNCRMWWQQLESWPSSMFELVAGLPCLLTSSMSSQYINIFLPCDAEVSCPELESPHHAALSVYSREFGSVAVVTCNYGHTMNTNAPRTVSCMANKRWSAHFEDCEREEITICLWHLLLLATSWAWNQTSLFVATHTSITMRITRGTYLSIIPSHRPFLWQHHLPVSGLLQVRSWLLVQQECLHQSCPMPGRWAMAAYDTNVPSWVLGTQFAYFFLDRLNKWEK